MSGIYLVGLQKTKKNLTQDLVLNPGHKPWTPWMQIRFNTSILAKWSVIPTKVADIILASQGHSITCHCWPVGIPYSKLRQDKQTGEPEGWHQITSWDPSTLTANEHWSQGDKLGTSLHTVRKYVHSLTCLHVIYSTLGCLQYLDHITKKLSCFMPVRTYWNMHFAFISQDECWFSEQHPWDTDESYHNKQHLECLLKKRIKVFSKLKTNMWIQTGCDQK